MTPCATPEQHPLVTVAVHEAGHVVVGLEHGRILTDVWATERGGSAWFEGAPLSHWRGLVCHVAGVVAEDMHALRCPHAGSVLRLSRQMMRYGQPELDLEGLSAGDDMAGTAFRARLLASPKPGADVVSLVLQAETTAQRLLWRRWADVCALARELCRAGRLSGAEALEVMGE